MTQPSRFTPEQDERADKRLKLQKELDATIRDLRGHYPQFLAQRPGALEKHKAFQKEEGRLRQELQADKAAYPWVTEEMLKEADQRYFEELFAASFAVVSKPQETGSGQLQEVPWMMRHISRKELEE